VRQRKTDYGTIILHWTFVAAFAVALVTGLRIATETPDRTWINWFDAVLPRGSAWVAHMQAAVVLVSVAIGYIVYMLRSGLGRRVQLDRVRPARAVRPRAGEVERRDRADVLDFLCHDVGAA
jgi:cytochrome b subunit of formate dehydrogenase